MVGNKRLLIFRDKICTHQKYMLKVKWKRSTKLIFLKFSGMKWNIFYNFKVKCYRPLFLCLEVPNVYPPIAVVQIDSYSKVNKIRVAHFWVCMVATVGAFIDCEIRASPLLSHQRWRNWTVLRLIMETFRGVHSSSPPIMPSKTPSKSILSFLVLLGFL
jgi:hypothetical protein